MQVIELESRVEQLLAENRRLSDARNMGQERDEQIALFKRSFEYQQAETARLTEVNEGLNSSLASMALQQTERYRHLETQYAKLSRELEQARGPSPGLVQETGAQIAALHEETKKQLDKEKGARRQAREELEKEKRAHRQTMKLLEEATEKSGDSRLAQERMRHADARKRLEAINQKLQKLHDEVAEKDDDLEEFKAELSTRNDEIERLKTGLSTANGEVKSLREQLAGETSKRIAELAKLQDALAAVKQIVNAL